MADDVLDLAVVGGGVSGVYTAWQLMEAGVVKRATVVEASDHIGGRLLSVRPPGIDNMVAELGGMRILPQVQPRIKRLVEKLNIQTYPFPVDEPENISYLRGTYLRLSSFSTSPAKVPYHLTFQEYGNTSSQILVNAIEQIVPGITNSNLTEAQRRQMAQQARFDGRPLYQQGFWNVLMRVISGEAYHLGIDAGGYESTLSNWNAADAIPWFLSDFGVAPQYEGFKNGFQEVPLALAKLFEKRGGKIRLETPVKGFDWVERDQQFELHLRDKSFRDVGSIRAKALILAMPRRSLELLTPESPLLKTIPDLIKSVTPRPLFKLFTTYTNPWWRAAGLWQTTNQTFGEWSKGSDGKNPNEWKTLGVTSNSAYVAVQKGRTTTDLPVRQTYYWPTSDGMTVTEGPAMLMASYDDGLNIGYWDGFRDKRGIEWHEELRGIERLEPFVGELARDGKHPEWSKYAPSKIMVREMQRQLALIHGLAFTPKVQDAAFKDWGDEPFGGGWNNWNIGVRSWEVKEQIIQPFDGSRYLKGKPVNIPLYICGEAYSDSQGWVEGALQTADMVLKKFGISDPLQAKTTKKRAVKK
jgi:monoamine oxidase